MTDTENQFLIDDVTESQAVREGTISIPPIGLRSAPQTDDENPPQRRGDNRDDEDEPLLPDIETAASLLADEGIADPPLLVDGILHQGLKCVIASSSKARKTWILLDLALSVASGGDWWGRKTTQGRVLFVNFEIPKPFLKQRIQALRRKKVPLELQVNPSPIQDFDVLTLRGFSRSFKRLIPELIERIEDRDYKLIIIDPIYKGLAGKDENAAGDIGELCNTFEHLAVETGAAVVYSHHYSKGNQARKEAIDRLGGSGVFARDADTIITLTQHETENCYTVDLILRNLPEQEPFVVQWDYPVMAIRNDLDPEDLDGKAGRPKEVTGDEVLKLLEDGPLKFEAWKKQAMDDLGISPATFARQRKDLEVAGKIEKAPGKKGWQIKAPAPAQT